MPTDREGSIAKEHEALRNAAITKAAQEIFGTHKFTIPKVGMSVSAIIVLRLFYSSTIY